MTMSSSLSFGNTIIEYQINFARRKTASIEVHPDQTVMVIAPDGSQIEAIEALLHKRASWIVRQQQQFANYAPPEVPRAYLSGESYRYLGRQYRLKVCAGDEQGIKLERSYIYLTVADRHNPKQVQHILEQWYRTVAKQTFNERLEICYPRVERLGVPYPSLTIRTMKTRWGSCSASGQIILNPRLVQTPIDCIDYVIFHELCHLKEHNHSKHYYKLLDQVLPDWREKRQKLNRFEF